MTEIEPPVVDEETQPVPTQLSLPAFTPPSGGDVIISNNNGNAYTIGPKIGEGNFGVVYSCVDTWGNELAAKVLKPRGLPYESIRNAAVSEFQKLLSLRNPCITFIHDAFEYRHTFYIITERCTSTVAELISLKDFKGEYWVMPIAKCLLQAVHYLHTSGFVHQDIHPGNVFSTFVKDALLDTQIQAITFKLGDLGIAKFISEMDPANSILADWMLPPEYLNPSEFGKMDHRVDIYHSALLLCQVLLGKETQYSKQEILEGGPRQLALSLNPPFSFAFEKALRRHVDFRTATALEFWRDLNTQAI